jgi:hypothetical protein
VDRDECVENRVKIHGGQQSTSVASIEAREDLVALAHQSLGQAHDARLLNPCKS